MDYRVVGMLAAAGLLFVVGSGLVTAAEFVHPRITSCVSCHSENTTADFQALDTHKCLDCHDQAELDANIRKVSSGDAGPVEQSAGTDLTIPGASQAQFYGQSRLGPQANAMVLIPAGEFTMGSNERLSDEGPEHKVTLPAYYLDKYEVTNLQYKQFIDDTGRRSPPHFENRTYPEGTADHPVVFVSWMDADAYCKWAGKRLPTDAEWEKGARGTDARRFPWGNEFSIDRANTPQLWKELNREGGTMPVGSFESGKSAYGLYDMSGNVWEWTASWYEAYPGNKNKTQNYGQIYKTLKGGSWWDCSFYKCGISAPTYNRAFFLKSTRNESFGFRCAKDADEGGS